MHPVICTFGPFTIYAYGLMLAAAFAAGSFLACLKAKKENVNPEIIFNLSFVVFISGIAGARILYVIQNASYYLKNPVEIFMLPHGGLSWAGGLVLGIISGTLYIKKKKQPLYKTLDLIVPFTALAQAIGRIGCLLNGCCFGKVTKYGIYFKSHDSTLIPTQLFSSLALIFIFIILRFLQERPHRQGEIFYTYLLLYSAKRFFIEFWRADNENVFYGLTLFQISSIIIFCIASAGLILIRRCANSR